MAFKMNKAAFNFGKGTGSSRLTKTPLYKSPPMGSEADQRREAKLMKEGPAVSGEMDAVVVTPKMEEKRDKKKAREKKRKDKKLARLDKKKARVEFGKDSDEFKAADANLDSKKTGQNKAKAKAQEIKTNVTNKVNETVGKVKGKVDELKTKHTKSDEEKQLKQKQNLAKLKRKNPEKYAKLEAASKIRV